MSAISTNQTVVVNDLQPTHSKFEQAQPENQVLKPWTNEYDGEIYSQEGFLEYGPTFVNATCGLGAGKTVMGIMRTVANVEYWNPGATGMIISPTVPNLKNAILPEMRKWGILDDWEFKGKGSDEPGLHSPNGTRIILESADNKRKIGRLRGPSVAWVWIDEPAEVYQEAFDVAIGRVRTGDYQNVFVTGTPKGFNWVYHRFHPDGNNPLSDVHNVFNIPSFANPHNPDTYEDILSSYEGAFYEQEALGMFVKHEGLIYDWFDDDNKVEVEDLPDSYDEVIYGLDPGGTNPTAIVCFARDGDYWFAVDEFYERRAVNEDIIRQFNEMETAWGPGPIYADHEPRLLEELKREGLNAKNAEKDVIDGIRALYGMEDEIMIAKSCQNLINEFNSYQWKDTETDKPVKQNDHLMDAMRYAIYSHGGSRAGWLRDWAEGREE